MNVYFSGSGQGEHEVDPRLLRAEEVHHRLLSCHDSYIRVAETVMDTLIAAGVSHKFELLFDSGAFTAWSKGSEVNMDHLLSVYSRMAEKKHLFKAMWFINLDKIPAEKGRTASPDEIVEAMDISRKNCDILTAALGNCVIPVYHQNEPQDYLLELAANYDYICGSPRNDVAEKSRVAWSKEVHALIDTKTHGLATTGNRQLGGVPWFSVDSATWIAIGSYGGIFHRKKSGLMVLPISSQSGELKNAGKHFNTFSPIEQDFLNNYFESQGFTLEGLAENHVERMLFNRIEMLNFARDCAPKKALSRGLFDL